VKLEASEQIMPVDLNRNRFFASAFQYKALESLTAKSRLAVELTDDAEQPIVQAWWRKGVRSLELLYVDAADDKVQAALLQLYFFGLNQSFLAESAFLAST
jgi:hypothetical protein